MRLKLLSREKVSFLIAGFVNVLLTNILLQTLLYQEQLGVIIPAFISQLFNAALGYILYGKYVFRGKRLRSKSQIIRFCTLMTILWLLNSYGISFGEMIGFSRRFSAIVMIPLLALLSYTSNKFIFQK